MSIPPPNAQLALCAQTNPDLFFPDDTDREMLSKARQVCARCPVRVECLTYAVESFGKTSDWGIWGGSTKFDRTKMRRDRKLIIIHLRKLEREFHDKDKKDKE
jgi:WhiB family redox-sensing transcriptional regulator